MALNLQTVFDDAQRASATNPSDRMGVIKAALSAEGVTRDDVESLLSEATEKFTALNETDPSDSESLENLQILADIVVSSRGTTEELDAKAEELRAQREELATSVLGGQEEAPAEDAESEDEQAEGEGDADAEAEVVAEAEAATVDAAEAVVASAPAPKPVDLSKISKAAPKVEADDPAPRAVITAAADVRNIPQGKHLSKDELVAAAVSKIEAMPRPYSYAEGEVRSADQSPVVVKAGVGQIRADVPQDLVASGANDDQVIEHAANQKRLPGGGLVAAGGWCAPSETLYELSPLLADSNAGLIDVPEIQVKRGGIRTAGGLDFATVWAGNAGLIQTEAQAIAGTEKEFYRPRDLLEDGRMRALMVVAPERLEGSEDVPTAAEAGFADVDLVNWRGIVAPPGLDQADQDELIAIVEEMVQTPEWKAAVERNRWKENMLTGEPFRQFLVDEQKRVTTILEDLNLS